MAELNGAPPDLDAVQALALVNYGHYTSMRVEDQRIRGLSQHLDRLVHDCQELFGAALDRERVRQFIQHAINGRHGAFVVRVTVFDPATDIGHPGSTAEPDVLVTTRTAAAWPPPPLCVQSVNYRRDLPEVKHIGIFGALWNRTKAQRAGFDDALFVDSSSFVMEGPTWNMGFFDGERVVWPSAKALPGVTMRLLKQVHEQTVTAAVNLRDISDNIEAAFVTNTSVGVRPISGIDDIELPDDHPIIELLRKEYQEIPPEQL